MRKKWFRDPKRVELIKYIKGKIDENTLSSVPNEEDVEYTASVNRANLVWYKSLMHIADPSRQSTYLVRVDHPLSVGEFEKWLGEKLDELTFTPPSENRAVGVFIQQLIHNIRRTEWK